MESVGGLGTYIFEVGNLFGIFFRNIEYSDYDPNIPRGATGLCLLFIFKINCRLV